MAKGFTPLIGLAVVVALALAAVFGSMSLANPVAAQDDTVTDFQNLYIETTATTIAITWDAIDGHDAAANYEGRWAETTDLVNGNPTGSFTAGGGTNFAVDVSVAGRHTATISGLSTGREVTAQLRSAEDTSIEVEVLTATPTAVPTNAPTNLTVEGGAGEATLKWDYTQPTADGSVMATGWQYRIGETGSPGPWMTIPNLAVSASNTFKVTGIKATQAEIDAGTETDPTYPLTRVFGVRALNGTTPEGTGVTGVSNAEIAVPPLPRLMLGEVTAMAGHGEVTLSWARVAAAARYSYIVKDGDEVVQAATPVGQTALSTVSTTVMHLENGTKYTFEVSAIATKADADADPPVVATHRDSEVMTAVATPMPPMIEMVAPSFAQSSDDPGDSANYTVTFQMTSDENTRLDDLVIEFHEDYGIPSSIRNTSVAITTQYHTNDEVTFTPEDVTVDGEKIILSLGDMNEDDSSVSGGTDYELDNGEVVKVHFRQSAGITTPTEAKGYNLVAITFGETEYEYKEETHPAEYGDDESNYPMFEASIVRKISLSEEDGGLGDSVDATGKGFKNGTTLTVFVDQPTNVMWDHDGDDETDMVLLTFDSATDAANQNRTVRSNNWTDYLKAMDNRDYVKTNVQVVDTTISRTGEERPLFTGMHPDATALSPRASVVQGPNGRLELGEDVLCVVGAIGSDDVGKCSFTVTHPTFVGGINYINSVDGRSNVAPKPDTFDLTASISATPAGGSPGEIMVVQVVDFPSGAISKIEFARTVWCPVPNGQETCPGDADSTGSGSFQIKIPNTVRAGVQELRVTSSNPDVDATTNVTFVGPQIQVTPGMVQANQRISLVGTGFSPNTIIGDDGRAPDGSDISKISIGGDVIDPSRINDGQDVKVDSGGNWSAAVDLPLSEATTAEGDRAIRVTDSGARTGAVIVSVPARVVTVTPDVGRVGTIAVVRGTGFPSKNDEGSSFNIEVKYDANNDKVTTVSAQPDASGRFETQLRIPTTAAIPSTNTIRVAFEDSEGVNVVTTVSHEVPEGVINLSETSGGPGSTVTVNGEGFKSFVPISLVRLGILDVTPAPKPSTDGNGMMSFDITIPGLDVGIQTIEVQVGGTTSSTGFTVIESGINPGDIKPVAEAVEELGDNLISVWNFNNDTKVWSFYDPTLAEGNTLTHMITGETYLIRVKTDVEVILNRDTRSLTCVGGNCWNQVVW